MSSTSASSELPPIISIVQDVSQEARLLQQLGDELKFEPEKLELGEATQMTEESSESDKVRFLEDIFQLLDGPEEEGGSKRG
ncbi:hypothetical protein GUITHDRAFT_107376 [Guillardia theta CCMP2712]|uniref:Uncharacterized protein n=1 Tax=Guillardia theta (strain CCMP2712) TaxID=905079 RepID=L1JEM6_GUITC|nr:hypothetical protein GUITHDRAFT_107376 [Guillardia theta CCMP2712]EKX46589.1 hypothetical protein GUITHDRAFT_107376 [Guillardia theta CCMP2712]|eukprot:XP_005833569.1 hypothetical protein GUITHDRAFT_107376 [Guillardia theta CCMP2712]